MQPTLHGILPLPTARSQGYDLPPAIKAPIEKGAWGAYRSEFYATCDYLPIYKEQREKALGK